MMIIHYFCLLFFCLEVFRNEYFSLPKYGKGKNYEGSERIKNELGCCSLRKYDLFFGELNKDCGQKEHQN